MMRRVRWGIAILILALSACAVAGCGGSSPSRSGHGAAPYTSCLSAPAAVTSTAELVALAEQGTNCQAATSVMMTVIKDLGAGRGGDGSPVVVAGWRCFSLNATRQTTCIRGAETISAQYLL